MRIKIEDDTGRVVLDRELVDGCRMVMLDDENPHITDVRIIGPDGGTFLAGVLVNERSVLRFKVPISVKT